MADQGPTRIIVNPTGGGGRASQRVAAIKGCSTKPGRSWNGRKVAAHNT
jgi:hypothetical protein